MCTSKPKVPAPTPVIERQAYRSPAPREGLGGSGDASRRRRLMGIATGSQGDVSTASTTRRVFGGDDQLNPSIGGGGGSPVAPGPTAAPAVQATAALTPRQRPAHSSASTARTPVFGGGFAPWAFAVMRK